MSLSLIILFRLNSGDELIIFSFTHATNGFFSVKVPVY